MTKTIAEQLEMVNRLEKENLKLEKKQDEADRKFIRKFGKQLKNIYSKSKNDLTEIYELVNSLDDDKIYIGKANKYVKNGAQGIIEYGAEGRFKAHVKRANSHDTKVRNECPRLYNAIRVYKDIAWDINVLAVVPEKFKKTMETIFTLVLQSYLPKYGYNISIGDNKPISGQNRLEYEQAKALGNSRRATGGSLKKSKANKDLPDRILHKLNKDGEQIGYRVRMVIRGKTYDKSYSKAEYSKPKLLEKAVEYRDELEKFLKDSSYKMKEIPY